jgi:hypothetical protein
MWPAQLHPPLDELEVLDVLELDAMHMPALHVWPATWQSVQAPPPVPHALSCKPPWHVLLVSQQPFGHIDMHDMPPELLEVLDELDVLDASSPPLLLVLLLGFPPPSSPLEEVLVEYELLDPLAEPDDPPDPLFEPPKLLLLKPLDPPDELNLPVGGAPPAAHAPTTPLAVTAKSKAATLNPAFCIDSLVYAQPRLKQRGSTSED